MRIINYPKTTYDYEMFINEQEKNLLLNFCKKKHQINNFYFEKHPYSTLISDNFLEELEENLHKLDINDNITFEEHEINFLYDLSYYNISLGKIFSKKKEEREYLIKFLGEMRFQISKLPSFKNKL